MGRLRRVVALLRAVEAQQARIDDLEREQVRLSPQVAALEERVEELRRRLDDPALAATPQEQAEARGLVDEVRAEHARIRARISAAAVFEERLRVLEERAAGDVGPGSARPDPPADAAGQAPHA